MSFSQTLILWMRLKYNVRASQNPCLFACWKYVYYVYQFFLLIYHPKGARKNKAREGRSKTEGTGRTRNQRTRGRTKGIIYLVAYWPEHHVMYTTCDWLLITF